MKSGGVESYDELRGYGFIVDLETRERIVVVRSGLIDNISEGDGVMFRIEKGSKGPTAVDVQLMK